LKKTDVGGTQAERERILSTDELKQLRDQLPAAHMERSTEIAIWLMLSTLARVGELTQSRWEHIDFNDGTWTIPAWNSKNAKEHIIFLSEFAQRHFEELHTLSGWSAWCYPSMRTDGHLCLRSISKQIKDRQRDTALSNRSLRGLGALTLPGGNWTAHDLRRTGATLMGELGILSEVIEKCLNHVEANKLKRTYQRHELKSERREAWRVLGAHLDSLLHGKADNVIHANFTQAA
jgi:integrase